MSSSLHPIVPQTDPKANYLDHKDEIDAAIHRVLDSGRYVLGEEVTAFEEEFAKYIGVNFAAGVANGTDALELALRACGVGPGDGVLTVSHTAVATVAAIELAGATPVFVDIDPLTFTIDPDRLQQAISNHKQELQLKAIIPVHLYGHPADLPSIIDIARHHELLVIEDCAQSHGASINGRKTGTWGDLAAFSFYPTKNLGALGDGGIVVTNNENFAEKLIFLRQYGWKKRDVSRFPGKNSRLDEIQASILRVKLHYLDDENIRRINIAKTYNNRLSMLSQIITPACRFGEHVYHQYVVRTNRRDELSAYLNKNSIGTAIHYPLPVHLQPAYKDRIPIGSGGLPVAEKLYSDILSLPIYPQLTEPQLAKVYNTIEEFFSGQSE